jgi:hypothetical protein
MFRFIGHGCVLSGARPALMAGYAQAVINGALLPAQQGLLTN